jgi:uncharacterized membrane protein YphA (DoxX/SURF4 family)
MRIVLIICRILVGSLFVVSGLIKSNYVLGFMYKLEEYFEPGALNLEWLIPFALPLGIFIVVGEVLLGVALLVGALPKLTSTMTLIIMLFFTWLTFYTDTCDPNGTVMVENAEGVTEEIANQCVLACGCFGNAIPLTPKESFYKDLFLLVFVIPIFIGAWAGRIRLNSPKEAVIIYTFSILITSLFSMMMLDWMFPVIFLTGCLIVASFIQKRVEGKYKEWIMALGILLIAGFFQYWTIYHLPLKDYRPYAIGQSIRDNMKDADELNDDLAPGQEPFVAPEYATEYTFVNVNTKKDTVVMSNDWLKVQGSDWFKNTYEIAEDGYDGESVLIQDGYNPLILDFEVMSYEGDDYTYEIVGSEGYTFLHISKDMSTAHTCPQESLNALAKEAESNGHAFFALTSASYEEAEEYRHEYQAAYPFLVCDQTELKIVVRSNPGLILIHDGVVLGKWAASDIPAYEDLNELIK